MTIEDGCGCGINKNHLSNAHPGDDHQPHPNPNQAAQTSMAMSAVPIPGPSSARSSSMELFSDAKFALSTAPTPVFTKSFTPLRTHSDLGKHSTGSNFSSRLSHLGDTISHRLSDITCLLTSGAMSLGHTMTDSMNSIKNADYRGLGLSAREQVRCNIGSSLAIAAASGLLIGIAMNRKHD